MQLSLSCFGGLLFPSCIGSSLFASTPCQSHGQRAHETPTGSVLRKQLQPSSAKTVAGPVRISDEHIELNSLEKYFAYLLLGLFFRVVGLLRCLHCNQHFAMDKANEHK
eukprot:1149558-Amphidinium_carterae.1